MITLEQAKRLNAAGFPQDSSAAFRWYIRWRDVSTASDWTLRPHYDWGADGGNEHLAAPNSDELIAAIQERWDFTDISIEKAGVHWCIGIPARPELNYICGPELLDALVKLYCKLAEVPA